MVSDPIQSNRQLSQSRAELELLQLMLDVEAEASYPWNPADPDAEVYFSDLEQELLSMNWPMEEMESRWQSLSTQVDQIWAEIAPATTAETLQETLLQQFASRIPQNLLGSITEKAQQLLASNLTLADQLVQCVADVLPNWGEEDLQVLARPYAFAMRGSGEVEMIEAALRSVRCAAWTELSGIEQARLSLAIARYALAHGEQPGAKS